MKKKDIEKLISQEIQNSCPNKASNITGYTKPTKEKQTFKFNKRFVYALVSFSLVICLSLGAIIKFLPKKNNDFVLASEGSIILDINPSLELKYDKNGFIVNATGLNADGKLLIVNNDYKGKFYKDFINELVNDCKDLGYFSTEKQNNAILVTVLDKNGENYKSFSDVVNKQFETAFDNKQLQGVVVSDQDLTGESKNGLTVQKTSLVNQVVELSKNTESEKTFEEIMDKSISELYALKEQMTIDSVLNDITTQLPILKEVLDNNKQEISNKISSLTSIPYQEIERSIKDFCDLISTVKDLLLLQNEFGIISNEQFNGIFIMLLNSNVFNCFITNEEISTFVSQFFTDSICIETIYNNISQYFNNWKTENYPQKIIENRKNKHNKPPMQNSNSATSGNSSQVQVSTGESNNGSQNSNHEPPINCCPNYPNCNCERPNEPIPPFNSGNGDYSSNSMLNPPKPPMKEEFTGNWFGKAEEWGGFDDRYWED